MSPGQLAHPEWGTGIVSLCGAAAMLLLLARWRARSRRRLLGPALHPGSHVARDVALLVGLAAIGTALLGPRIGERLVTAPSSGIDVVLLLDTSRSMDATDTPPSRFDRARQAARDTLARLRPGDRAALAVFASRGALLAPLTPDRNALHELIAALDTHLIRPAGSSLGSGVRSAIGAFEAGSERPRLIVVLSDGEDPRRSGDLGIPDALRAEVRVLTAAFGSETGARVPDHGVPLRDAAGAAVISRRRADRLERLASASGGVALRANEWGELDLRQLETALQRDSGGAPGELVERRMRATHVLPFAALALVLLVAEGLPWRLTRRPVSGAMAFSGQRPFARGPVAAALALGAILLLGAGPAQAPGGGPARPPSRIEVALVESPRDPVLLVELGLERLALGRRDAARRAFLAAALSARDEGLAALAYYDLGVAALEEGDYEAARDAFFDALALDPSDREARYNLEWSLKALPGDETPPPLPETEAGEEDPEPERPEPTPELPTQPEAAGAEQPGGLSEEERQRWLARVDDDLGRALRSAASAGAGEQGQHRAGPAW
jgi:Ca-activated chloride channel family protein